jgi:hypothetical protein
MVMSYRNEGEGWGQKRESAQSAENCLDAGMVQETPPHHTTIGGGVLETADTFK